MDQPHAPSGLRVIELSVLDAAATRLKCHKTTINQLLPYDEAIMQNYGLVSVAIINHFLPRCKVKRARRLTFLIAFLVQLVHRGLCLLENMRAASSDELSWDNSVKSYLSSRRAIASSIFEGKRRGGQAQSTSLLP